MPWHQQPPMKTARMGQTRQLYLLMLVPLLVLFVFSYLPMVGLIIAFQDYNMFKGFFGSKWAGIAVFKEIFTMPGFWAALRNTFMLNGLNLLAGFPAPIILALLLNEVRSKGTKRTFQSTLYLPHFLSWAIIGSLAVELLADNTGLRQRVHQVAGREDHPFPFGEVALAVHLPGDLDLAERGMGYHHLPLQPHRDQPRAVRGGRGRRGRAAGGRSGA